MVDKNLFVTAVGAGGSPDGRVSMLQFKLANGQTVPITFQTEAAASILLNIEQALGTLAEQQRLLLKGEDPRAFFPIAAKRVSKIQGAVASDGTPILSLALASGVRLDFAVDQSQIRQLIDWLEQLESDSQKPQKAPH